jgi:hypothetical protein
MLVSGDNVGEVEEPPDGCGGSVKDEEPLAGGVPQ